MTNFRSYELLDLDFGPGMVIIEGANGQGKSNLVEALYLLAIAKSLRASSERELARWQPPTGMETYTQVTAAVERGSSPVRVQIDFRCLPQEEDSEPGLPAPAGAVQKYVKVNGAPRRASDLVGEVLAVIFTAQDLDLVFGSPSVRRRYLDILISQFDRRYLRAVQRYQRVVTQRNHLLKAIGDRRARLDELAFWDDELVAAGGYIMAVRAGTIASLSALAEGLYRELSDGGEDCELVYASSVDAPNGAGEEAYAAGLREALEQSRGREVAQGHTVSGPHRDDLMVKIRGMPAGQYASRGQSRTVALAMKLAEAANLHNEGGDDPILLLDDALSELDARRRGRVMERVAGYHQSFVTTADLAALEWARSPRMTRYTVRAGAVETVPGSAGGQDGGAL